jgi:hypothetical protein
MANQHTAPYTDEELDLIESRFLELGASGLAKIMPGRTSEGIRYKARFLDIEGGAKKTNHEQQRAT